MQNEGQNFNQNFDINYFKFSTGFRKYLPSVNFPGEVCPSQLIVCITVYCCAIHLITILFYFLTQFRMAFKCIKNNVPTS